MKHDKLVFIRIICLVGIIGEVLFPNSTGRHTIRPNSCNHERHFLADAKK